MSNKSVEGLLKYIEKAPTAFHAVEASKEILVKAGFTQLNEMDGWKVEPNGKYFVTRNHTSIIAFTIPADGWGPFHIVAAHSDSPCFKIKDNADIVTAGKYIKLNTEGYGGAIFSSWLDRPLSIAGRIYVDECDGTGHGCRYCNGIVEKLVNFDKGMVVIPNLAIHMNREVNDGYKFNKQIDMIPLWGMTGGAGGAGDGAACGAGDVACNGGAGVSCGGKAPEFKAVLAKEAGVKMEKILGTDLMLYVKEEGRIWGINEEFVSAPRLDDLACAYAGLCAITDEAVLKEHAEKAADEMFAGKINVCAVFDNEEVGSGTKQGADSTFLYDVMRRICLSMGKGEEDYYRAVAGSFMVSADNAHAVHPNHPEKSDENNRCYINEGVVIKFNAAQKYTTDAASAAYFRKLCNEAKVPTQVFANRSDMAGGSTLGNISNAHVSLNTVDIGLPQLAMHSAYETMGTKDLGYMIEALKAFYL